MIAVNSIRMAACSTSWPCRLRRKTPAASRPADWHPFFTAAGLELTQFSPSRACLEFACRRGYSRAAWDEHHARSARRLCMSRASALHGKLVGFFPKWFGGQNPRALISEKTRADKYSGRSLVSSVALVVIRVLGLFLAYRNHSRGKSDRAGRACCLCRSRVCTRTGHLFCPFSLRTDHGHHRNIDLAVSTGLFVSGFVWVLYLAWNPTCAAIGRR